MITNEQYKYNPVQGYKDTTKHIQSPPLMCAHRATGGPKPVDHPLVDVEGQDHRSYYTHQVLGLDSNTLGVDSCEVGVLEERDEVCLGRLLQRHHCRGLEAQVGLVERAQVRKGTRRGKRATNLEVLRNFTNKPLEGQLADEQLRRLLVPTDLTERDSSGPEAMRLLHTTSRGLQTMLELIADKSESSTYGGGLARGLGSELLARGLATGGLAGGLLRAGHC